MTTPDRSYGNFRRAEEASNAQGTTREALLFAQENAKNNPTKANLAILAQTNSARQETIARQIQPTQGVIAGMSADKKETDRLIAEAQAAITGVNKAGAAFVAAGGEFNPIADIPTTKTQVDSIAAIKALLSSYGIGDLGDAITNAVIKGYSNSTIELIMQDPNSTDPLAIAFQKRFPANKIRSAAGKSVLSPAEYLRAERSYSEVLKSYGVSNLASKEKLSQFISNDISATEVADRVGIAINRVQNADADTKKALAEFYPMLNQADIVSAVLDPTEGLPALQRKIQIAEIGGAALAQGIKTSTGKTNIAMGAAALADLGVTQAQARAGFQQVAELTPRGSMLSDISTTGEKYGQLQAEQEAFQGLASAKRARVALTAEEQARFQGLSGTKTGSLASQTRGLI